ncbi:aldolase/citrate lyase family protein [Rhodopseudomonas palustris]
MTLPVNAFKRGLRDGRSQIGTWNTIPGPVVSELLAGAGFDWVLLDTEHALTDIPDIFAMLQAVAAYPVSAVVRPQTNDTVLIKRLLDHGAQTLLLPYVQSAAEAEAAVRAMRYAPRGVRGVSGMTRASRYGAIPDYVQRAEEELCLLVQVETAEALSQIEAIAAVDGVDGLFIGPSDLAASMGHPGNARHPEVVAAIDDAIRRIVATGKAAGILTLDPAYARHCLELGTSFTAVGVDMALLRAAASDLAKAFGRGA